MRRVLMVAAALVASGTVPARAQVPDTVRVAQGRLAGVVAASGVREFRGIPFAAPPVGRLRWRPPEPPPRWAGVRPAAAFAARCMQQPIFSDMVFRSPGISEDCLYLNVWAPPRATGRRLPVLVYFYGGGFVAGDASELRYDGESLARRGIVVVTPNYRLGVFGLLALRDLSRESRHHASGNYGFLDQVAALRWVRSNIAAFGGDPARVTIGGESAGSMSVSALMASPLSRGLMAGAIGESGALFRPTAPPLPLLQAEEAGTAFMRHAGATSLEGLRAMPAESLLAAASGVWFRADVDGYFLPATPKDLFAEGRQSHVPLLAGWNSEEQDWHTLLGDSATPARYDAVLDSMFGSRAAEARRLFPGATPEQVAESATLLAGAGFTVFSTWKWTDLQRRTGGRAVYRYVYAHPRPASRDPAAMPLHSGAVHSAEIEYALGNLATNRVYAWTATDSSISAAMESYLANFVKTGNPNGPGLPTWPRLAAGDSARVMVLDSTAHAEPSRHEAGFRFLDSWYTSRHHE